MPDNVDIPPLTVPTAESRPQGHAELASQEPVLLEHGGPIRGEPQTLNTRLFVQFHAFTGCLEATPVTAAVRKSGLSAVVYANLNDPRGLGVLFMSEDPGLFAGAVRELLIKSPFRELAPTPAFTMIGRTYGSGREPKLKDFLLHKVPRNVLNSDYPWAIWYPLRRTGAFNLLPRAEQGKILYEHGMLGRRYGEAGYAVDVRLECHGIDRDDNEFVIGLIGPELYPLSKLVKDMRSTRQTAEFIQAMGPFFVGKVLYQAPLSQTSR